MSQFNSTKEIHLPGIEGQNKKEDKKSKKKTKEEIVQGNMFQ